MVHPSVHHLTLLGGGRSHHRGPWREGHRTLSRLRRIDRSLRPSTPGGQVAGPVIHEPAATIEQIRAPVGCLDLAADLVRQGSLCHLARMIGLRPPNPGSRAGVMEGPGEISPRSGVRRGRSPSPAPMSYIG